MIPTLEKMFQEVGVTPYNSAVLIALEDLGEADTRQLADMSGVPRTSCYGCLERLVERGMAEVVGRPFGARRWKAVGWAEVARRLEAEAHEAAVARCALVAQIVKVVRTDP